MPPADEHDSDRFPPCPFLPDAPTAMDWRSLHRHRGKRGGQLYRQCLTYGQYLWTRGLAARALLAVDRGLLCDVPGGDPELLPWPLPFRAVGWIVASTPPDVFIGNPRIHYQHLADRVRAPRQVQRRWRAWACWHLVRLHRPELPPDPRHAVQEPTPEEIEAKLVRHGIERETHWWRKACADAVQNSRNCP